MISKNPANVVAHELLAEAAALGDAQDCSVCIRMHHQTSTQRIRHISKIWEMPILDAEDPDGAITIGNEIMKFNPGDGEAEEMMKKASVSVAMTKGNWENSTDFRTQLKDQEEAQSLEQSSKIVNDKKSLEDLIRSTYSLVQQEPENLITTYN